MKDRGIGAEEIATKALRAKRTAMREFSTRLPHRILEQNFSTARETLHHRQCRTGDRARISVNPAGGNADVSRTRRSRPAKTRADWQATTANLDQKSRP
jgi:hypothetical protein